MSVSDGDCANANEEQGLEVEFNVGGIGWK